MVAASALLIDEPVSARQAILEALKKHDDQSIRQSSARYKRAVIITLLSPLAVLCLAIALFLPVVGLVLLECVFIIAALLTYLPPLRDWHKGWIQERLRTELLRREEQLFLARVGPYLETVRGSLSDLVTARLLVIEDPAKNPFELLRMADDKMDWSEALEDAHHTGKTRVFPETAFDSKLENYLKHRVHEQRDWFLSKSTEHGKRAQMLENGVICVLIFALISSAFHIGSLWHPSGIVRDFWHDLVTVLAILCPAIGAAIVAWLAIQGSSRLSRSYRNTAMELTHYEQRLTNLQTEDAVQFRFRRVVLEVERLLTDELRQWWLVIYPETPKAR